jgi:hypothetical protein
LACSWRLCCRRSLGGWRSCWSGRRWRCCRSLGHHLLAVSLDGSAHHRDLRIHEFIELHFLFFRHRYFRFRESFTKAHESIRRCGRRYGSASRRGPTRSGRDRSQHASRVAKSSEIDILSVCRGCNQQTRQQAQRLFHRLPFFRCLRIAYSMRAEWTCQLHNLLAFQRNPMLSRRCSR